MKQFEWTDELAIEYTKFWKNNFSENEKDILEKFKQSKQPKQEWKVISLQTENYTFNLHLNSMYKSGDVEFSLEHLLNVQKAQITTVQRLSDGEIFSVGDNTNYGKIVGFEICQNKMKVLYAAKGDWQFIQSISKAKQPLFTTEDGVPVYEGDKYCSVALENDWDISEYNCEKTYLPSKKYIEFSTEAAAEKYVLENKPQLFLSDVERAYVGDKKSKEYISLIDNLRLIIRQKQ